jgi:hypothetical protein
VNTERDTDRLEKQECNSKYSWESCGRGRILIL